jgi:hypothetical protein
MVERGRNFSNMSKEECEALRDLKSYKDVVFKKLAYKESAVSVVWGLIFIARKPDIGS